MEPLSRLYALEQYQTFIAKLPVLFASIVLAISTEIFLYPQALAYPLQLGKAVGMGGVMAGLLWQWTRVKGAAVDPQTAQLRIFISFAVGLVATAFTYAADIVATRSLGADFALYIGFGDFVLGLCAFVCLAQLPMFAYSFIALTSVACFAMFGSIGGPGGYGILCLAILATVTMIVVMRQHYSEFKRLAASNKRIEELMVVTARMADEDMLTNLPNRRFFFNTSKALWERVEQPNGAFAVGIVDLDGFKYVNDTYGHRVGDGLLREVAQRFTAALPRKTTLCRIGGDEFGLLIEDAPDEESLLACGQTFIDALEPPFVVGDLKISIGCSVGICSSGEAMAQRESLVEQADFALYEVKRSGRGRVALFSDAHRARMVADGAIEQALRTADLETEVYPYFQPIVNVHTGQATGFECLARWASPSLGIVSPGVFIPVAERAGLISRVTSVMFRKALAEMKKWPEDIGLSFNLSAFDLTNTNIVMSLLATFSQTGIATRRLTFEITETALIQDFSLALVNIDLIRRANIKVALDDFGTGYSSLSHVHRLPLNKLKIDRQFIKDIEHDEASRSVVRSILSLCQDMNIDCVIEGAESQAQIDAIREMGGNLIQGYYYSRPLAPENVPAFLDRANEAPLLLSA